MRNCSVRIGILAGEASGDLLGAKLIKKLTDRFPNSQIVGIGGPAMHAAGCHSLYGIEQLSVMGFIEPLLRLPQLWVLRRKIFKHFIKHRPDVFIGVDAPDFNIGLELKLRRAGIPVVHYVSPSVWAWRQKRIHKIAKAVDLMLTLLPFEAQFYEKHHVPVHYVGHPLAEQISYQPDVKAARRILCLDEHKQYVAILPGSRQQEIYFLSEPFLKAAEKISKHYPNIIFLTSHVNEERYQEFYERYKKFTPNLPIHFFTRRSQDVISASDVVLVTSGTATLETMLYKKPMVIAYRMSRFTYPLAKFLVQSPFIGLPNLLANEKIVPELIQDDVTPDGIAKHIFNFLENPGLVQNIETKFQKIHEELHGVSSQAVPDLIASIIKGYK